LIGRLWHGWVTPEHADEYERMLEDDVIPAIDRIDGYRGAYLLRRDLAGGVEFVTLTMFESLEAVRAFAGDDLEAAVVPERGRRLLVRFDERSAHYEVVKDPTNRRISR
jgi:heme-degrading monooxygenase HmoA